MNRRLRGSLLLIVTAAIWGASFVAQSKGAEYLGPFAFNAARSFLAGFALLIVDLVSHGARPAAAFCDQRSARRSRRMLILGGIACGAALAAACGLQQMGIASVAVGKAGFLTSLYIVLVPVIGMLSGRKVRTVEWLGVTLSLIGLYLLCVDGPLPIEQGDLLMLACALCYAVHILVVGRFSPYVDSVRLSCIQFFSCGIFSVILMFLFEKNAFHNILRAWAPLLYSGLLSSCVGYTLQIMSQRDVPPTVTSLILSLESVFAVLFGWLLLGQLLSAQETIGCAFMFCAITIAQMHDLHKARRLQT